MLAGKKKELGIVVSYDSGKGLYEVRLLTGLLGNPLTFPENRVSIFWLQIGDIVRMFRGEWAVDRIEWINDAGNVGYMVIGKRLVGGSIIKRLLNTVRENGRLSCEE